MAQDRKKFTVAFVRDLLPDPARTRLVFDADVTGFGVRVEPSGVKAWIVEFREPGSEQKRRQTIGRVDKVALDDARRAARIKFGELATGRSIHTEAVEAKRAETFGAVAKDFLKNVKKTKKPRTHDEYEKTISGALKTLDKRTLKSIGRADLRRLHEEVSERAPIVANRALAIFSAIWNFAARDELVKFGDNPAKGQVRNKENKRERFLTGEELQRLIEVLDKAEGEGLPWRKPARDLPAHKAKHQPKTRVTVFSPHVIGAIRLLLLTGARLNEILTLRFSEVDAERGLAFLPDSKTGKKPLVLNSAALEEIKRLGKVRENEFVVGGGADGKPRADIRKPWAAVTKAAGLEGFRIHDLRHSAASFAAGAGHSLLSIGGVLGHKQAATTARYAHLSASPVRAAAESIAEAVAAARSRPRS